MFPSLNDLLPILPELILCLAMCVVLIVPVLPPFQKVCRESHQPMIVLTLIALAAALLATLATLTGSFGLSIPEHHVFSGMLSIDRFALLFKAILYTFTMFIVVLWIGGTRDDIRATDSPDYVSLILGAVLGMSLMASATNFLMMFLAIEAASFPSYALAGFRKTTKRASEGSMKYVLFGAATSAIMVYGLSLLYGTFGTLDVSAIARFAGEQGMTAGLLLGLFGIIVGIGFKLSAVPMHFWCPDVFEGASFEITAFLSVASKGAAIILFVRILSTIGYFAPMEIESSRGMLVGIGSFIGAIGLITATWGNLTAYFQTNIKRLLAYSSIAHAGYMIMAASLLTASAGHIQPERLTYAILFYLTVYSCMNLGAFAVGAAVAKATGSEDLRDYAGLASRSPLLALALGIFLMALFGMPLTGGFWGKVYIGFEMWNQNMWWLVVGLVANTVFSLYFYMKPIVIMVFKPAEGRPAITVSPALSLVLVVAVLGVFATGIIPDQVTGWANDAPLRYVPNLPAVEAMNPITNEADQTSLVSREGNDQ